MRKHSREKCEREPDDDAFYGKHSMIPTFRKTFCSNDSTWRIFGGPTTGGGCEEEEEEAPSSQYVLLVVLAEKGLKRPPIIILQIYNLFTVIVIFLFQKV